MGILQGKVVGREQWATGAQHVLSTDTGCPHTLGMQRAKSRRAAQQGRSPQCAQRAEGPQRASAGLPVLGGVGRVGFPQETAAELGLGVLRTVYLWEAGETGQRRKIRNFMD